jgi:hypothetical protein
VSELPTEVLRPLFGTTRASDFTPALFLSRMVLKRVGLYPGNETRAAASIACAGSHLGVNLMMPALVVQ